MGAVRVVVRQDLPESFIAKCATGGKMMMLSVVLSISFTVNKMILKYQSGRKHELNDMMKRAKGKNCEDYNKSKQMIFVRSMSHDGDFWTDRLPADS